MSRLLYRFGHSAARHPWRVLAAWALIAGIAIALSSSFGGATNDTFRLPGAESQRAADALTDRFPAQSVNTAQVVVHSDARRHRSGRPPGRRAGHGCAGRRTARRRRDQPVRPARTHRQPGRPHRVRHRGVRHRQDRTTGVRRGAGGHQGPARRRHPGGVQRAARLGRGRRASRQRDDRARHRDRRPRRRVRVAGGDEPAHRRRPDRPARRQQRDRHPGRAGPGAVDHHDRRHDARSRRRHRLRAVRPGPAPAEPGRRHDRAGSRRPGERDGRAVRAVRGHHRGGGDREPPGGGHPDADRDGLGFSTDGGGHDGRCRHPAPRTARAGRPQGQQPPGALRAAEAGERPRHEGRSMGGEGRRPTRPLRPRRDRAARGPCSSGLRAADRVRRRRQRGSRQHPAHLLRPDRRRLRPGVQRPDRGGRRDRQTARTTPPHSATSPTHSPATRASPR